MDYTETHLTSYRPIPDCVTRVTCGEARDSDLDVLDPNLVRTMDDFVWAAAQGAQMCGFLQEGLLTVEHDDPRPVSAAWIVRHFLGLLDAYLGVGDEGWREIIELSRRAADPIHRRISEHGREPSGE
jgi:hypothetical protein